jgi:hypothetical protein
MENSLEQLTEQLLAGMWCEARTFAKPFVDAVLKSDIPESEKSTLIPDVINIGNAAYNTTVFDYDRDQNELGLKTLTSKPYSDKTIRTVLTLVKTHLSERSSYVNTYLLEFNDFLRANQRLGAIAA